MAPVRLGRTAAFAVLLVVALGGYTGGGHVYAAFSDTGQTTVTVGAASDFDPVADVVFDGCGRARIVLDDWATLPVDATMTLSHRSGSSQRTETIEAGETTRSGAHGGLRVFDFRKQGPGKVQRVTVAGTTHPNPNQCAQTPAGDRNDGDEEDDDESEERDDEDEEDDEGENDDDEEENEDDEEENGENGNGHGRGHGNGGEE